MTVRPSRRRWRPGRTSAGLGTGVAGLALALTLATPNASSRPVPPTGGTAATQQRRPDPHIMDFAQSPAAHPMAPQSKRTDETAVAPDADGCDHHYGALNICAPAAFPPGVGAAQGARCTWLLQHGYRDLAVHGRDDLGLDTNHDGMGCDPGDAGGSR
ncbi:hypothetical protein E6W39_36585 [Kitasatospora acidiphila]|uniref:Excalibur calcium-binding domain-containing protein n=1 Tax=Kitasatospora acidiphila TaxID=2567942 RepID=A0A540WCM4_9ACTN|nr:hypothetical protein [Kitasatospora acidiphila]TQF06702.1 hypothetical protein E6W39_36585 [Kitasatospora acidiphila]